MGWDAETYDRRFSFVTSYGGALLDLLDPEPGERVVDLGCGTGHLAALIAERGADVEGIDADPAMVERARSEHPELRVRLGDARSFTVPQPVDAVFSNATVHWVPEADQGIVLAAVRRALRPGGRFVAEMGGAGNVATLLDAVTSARRALGLAPVPNPWCYPTPAEQANRLEHAGFRVRLLEHVDRPTELSPGDTAADWLRMFGRAFLADVDGERLDRLLAEADRIAAPRLRAEDGGWYADYVRLRGWAVAQ